jgi:hypothetical protein
MRRHFRTTLSWLIAANYALAITCGGLLHNHDFGPLADDDGCALASHGDHASHAAPPDNDSRPAHGPADPCRGESHCPVCQFLGQPSVAPQMIVVTASTALVAEVPQLLVARSAAFFAAPWHSRAPPQFA